MKTAHDAQWARFDGRLLMLGFGCIGQGVLPLLLRHLGLRPDQITIIAAGVSGAGIATSQGVAVVDQPVTRENYRRILADALGAGDFLLNLSVNVGSIDLIAWCKEHDCGYLDACIGPWAGGHFDASLDPEERSNYVLRVAARSLRGVGNTGPTAVLAHGVNPGLVSHFVKQALLDLARDLLPAAEAPRDRAHWAALAQRLGVCTIHIAERDTQCALQRKMRGEFVNTWSVEGFVGESCQPAELGWGSHERHWPAMARRHAGYRGAAIWMEQPGAATRVRSWTPLEGPYHGFLITHEESLSIAEYLTVSDGGRLLYRPTVHYAYHPCDDAVMSLHELAGRNWRMQAQQRVLGAADISSGMDELGVLLLGHARGAYWYGSRLTIAQARALCPHNTATSLQTTAGVLGGVVWALNHPRVGIVDPDEMDFREVLDVATPYLGELVGVYSDWTPLQDRCVLFQEDVDLEDPWQFKNVLVA